MSDYQRYKVRTEIAARLGWCCVTSATRSGAICWYAPGYSLEKRYARELPSLEELIQLERRARKREVPA